MNITVLYFLGMIGGQEVLLIAAIFLLLFGGKKIPELMRGLGKGIREFNDAKNNITNDIKNEMRELEKPQIDITEQNKVKREEELLKS